MNNLLKRRSFLARSAALTALPLTGTAAWAATAGPAYPDRPIKLVVPWPAGGVVDVATRIAAEHVAAQLGQPIVIDIRPGANGNIGTAAVKGAAPDGYTLLAGSMATVVNPLIDRTAKYTASDFVPIVGIGAAPNILVVPASSPVSTLQEFIALARQHPGHYNTPVPGVGTSIHLGLEILQQTTGIQLTPVNYKGQPPFLVDLVNGQLHFASVTAALAVPQIAAGKLKALAVVADQPLKSLPGVPALSAIGFANAIVMPWNGIFAPAGTPQHAVERLAAGFELALRDPAVLQRYDTIGAVVPTGPRELARFVGTEKSRWEKLVAERSISAEV